MESRVGPPPYLRTRILAELLIDAEEDPYLRAVLVGMLQEATAEGSVRGPG